MPKPTKAQLKVRDEVLAEAKAIVEEMVDGLRQHYLDEHTKRRGEKRVVNSFADAIILNLENIKPAEE